MAGRTGAWTFAAAACSRDALAAASAAALSAAALSAAALSAAAFSAAFFAAAARPSVTRFDSDCSNHSNSPASLFVQIKTLGGYLSVAFSVTQVDDAGAVGVGVGVADSLVMGAAKEAAD